MEPERASTRNQTQELTGLTLVLGGTGKTGRRIAARLEAKGVPVCIGSRSASPPFFWNNEAGRDACLQDVEAAYINYAPDLAMPGAIDAIQAFVGRGFGNIRHGQRRISSCIQNGLHYRNFYFLWQKILDDLFFQQP